MSSDVAESSASIAPGDDREPLVEIRGLKTYFEGAGLFGGKPVRAVDGVDLDIFQGETLGLVGESGCGKTTLGRTLLRLEHATEGTIKFDGTDVRDLSGRNLKDWRRNAQIVFQDPQSSLNNRMTVGEIIREPMDAHDWKTPRERRDRVFELLETVGLEREHYYRYPHQFSGGQRQRINIARTLTLEPEFIVLDEPVSALDVSVQAEVINLLEDLQDDFGLTYLFIAHDLSLVRHISDRVAVMYLGNILEVGPTEELFNEPANPYTRSLLSAIPKPDPTAEIDRITLHGTPPNPRYPPSGCPFRTRCPARIRPEEYRDLSDELWDRIYRLEEVLNERARADLSIRERIRLRLGRSTRFGTMEELHEEFFGDIEVPAEVQRVLDQVYEFGDEYEIEQAIALIEGEFGSVCTSEYPEFHSIGDAGRVSLCHRHRPEYEDPEPVFRERFG